MWSQHDKLRGSGGGVTHERTGRAANQTKKGRLELTKIEIHFAKKRHKGPDFERQKVFI
jgi:hypothetical protein